MSNLKPAEKPPFGECKVTLNGEEMEGVVGVSFQRRKRVYEKEYIAGNLLCLVNNNTNQLLYTSAILEIVHLPTDTLIFKQKINITEKAFGVATDDFIAEISYKFIEADEE